MTAPIARIICSLAAVAMTAACTNYYEIPLETPIRPKLDVSAFERILVAGFIAGGTEDVDGNLETTRLLRSQLRNNSELRVIDSDVLPLIEVASESRATRDTPVGGEDPVGSSNPNVLSPNSFGVARPGLGSASRCRGY